MKSFEEMANSALLRIKEEEKEKRMKRMKLTRAGGAACALCLVVLLGAGAIYGGILKNNTAQPTATDVVLPGGDPAGEGEILAVASGDSKAADDNGNVIGSGGEAVDLVAKDETGNRPNVWCGAVTVDDRIYLQAHAAVYRDLTCGTFLGKASGFGYYDENGERMLFADGVMLYRSAEDEDICLAKMLDGTLLPFVLCGADESEEVTEEMPATVENADASVPTAWN